MAVDSHNRILAKLFIGCSLTSDLKLQLSKSHPWKEALIMKNANEDMLQEIMFQNKSYLGIYCEQFGKTLSEIELIKATIIQKIKTYCPEYESEKLNFFVFPQIFVA